MQRETGLFDPGACIGWKTCNIEIITIDRCRDIDEAKGKTEVSKDSVVLLMTMNVASCLFTNRKSYILRHID